MKVRSDRDQRLVGKRSLFDAVGLPLISGRERPRRKLAQSVEDIAVYSLDTLCVGADDRGHFLFLQGPRDGFIFKLGIKGLGYYEALRRTP